MMRSSRTPESPITKSRRVKPNPALKINTKEEFSSSVSVFRSRVRRDQGKTLVERGADVGAGGVKCATRLSAATRKKPTKILEKRILGRTTNTVKAISRTLPAPILTNKLGNIPRDPPSTSSSSSSTSSSGKSRISKSTISSNKISRTKVTRGSYISLDETSPTSSVSANEYPTPTNNHDPYEIYNIHKKVEILNNEFKSTRLAIDSFIMNQAYALDGLRRELKESRLDDTSWCCEPLHSPQERSKVDDCNNDEIDDNGTVSPVNVQDELNKAIKRAEDAERELANSRKVWEEQRKTLIESAKDMDLSVANIGMRLMAVEKERDELEEQIQQAQSGKGKGVEEELNRKEDKRKGIEECVDVPSHESNLSVTMKDEATVAEPDIVSPDVVGEREELQPEEGTRKQDANEKKEISDNFQIIKSLKNKLRDAKVRTEETIKNIDMVSPTEAMWSHNIETLPGVFGSNFIEKDNETKTESFSTTETYPEDVIIYNNEDCKDCDTTSTANSSYTVYSSAEKQPDQCNINVLSDKTIPYRKIPWKVKFLDVCTNAFNLRIHSKHLALFFQISEESTRIPAIDYMERTDKKSKEATNVTLGEEEAKNLTPKKDTFEDMLKCNPAEVTADQFVGDISAIFGII